MLVAVVRGGIPNSAAGRGAHVQSACEADSANVPQVTPSSPQILISRREHFTGLEMKTVKHPFIIGAAHVASACMLACSSLLQPFCLGHLTLRDTSTYNERSAVVGGWAA